MKYRKIYMFVLLLSVLCLLLIPTHRVNAESLKEGLYKVGVNDTIGITVVGHSDLSIGATVTVDGTIAFPQLGSIYVKDKTLPEIEKEITDRLSEGYVKFPVVSVALLRSESKKVFVHGEVRRIGTLSYEKDLSIVKAIAIAGGITEEGLYGKIKLRRKREKGSGYRDVVTTDINNGIIGESRIEDMLLEPDDILIVERSDTFFIQGQALRNGQFVLEDNMTVERALILAGGISDEGMHGKLKLARKQKDGPGYEDIAESRLDNGVPEDGDIEDTLLQHDDIIRVERTETYFIQGPVAQPGQYNLEYGMTLGRAITIAGGVTEHGLHGKVKIRRKEEEKSGYGDVIEVKLDNGIIVDSDMEDMLLLSDDIVRIEPSEAFFIEGEVARPGQYTLEYGMTVGSAITVAGGITEGGLHGQIKVRRKRKETLGFEDIEIDLKGIIEGSETGDMPLLPDDILIVERSKTYILYGEVARIGEYPITDDTTVFTAIINAGGLNQWGSESRVKILRPSEEDGGRLETIKVNLKKLLDGDVDADVQLIPGDIVVVSPSYF